MSQSRKNLFEYDNYRVFLKDHYEASKLENKKFSFRYFSRLIGYSSPNFLKCVIDGSRNLTLDGIQRFTKALKFNKEEGHFFKNLVLLNQSKHDEEKRIYAQKILRSRAYRKLLPLKEAQFSYLAQWYLVPIRELIGLPEFQEDPHWIAQAMVPAITTVQAKRAIEELVRLGLVERDRGGRLIQTSSDITTPDGIISTFKADCLTELIKLGGESIKRVERQKRDISGVTIGLSSLAFEKIKEIAQRFRREIMEVANQDKDSSENIYQFNIQLYPLTDVKNKRENE